MRKKLFIIVSVVCVFLLCTACRNEPGGTTLSMVLDSDTATDGSTQKEFTLEEEKPITFNGSCKVTSGSGTVTITDSKNNIYYAQTFTKNDSFKIKLDSLEPGVYTILVQTVENQYFKLELNCKDKLIESPEVPDKPER